MSYSHAFLIGGMKCGTWTMFKLLRKHVQIAVCKPKEAKFFSKTERAQWGTYHELFNIEEQTRVLLDGTVQYSRHPDTANIAYQLFQFDKSARFIYLMRDPVRRIESQLAHRIARQEIKKDPGHRAKELRRAVNYSRYFTQLGIYANIFGLEQIYPQTFENLIVNQVNVARDCFEFLGLKQPKRVQALPPQNVRKPDHGADKLVLTTSEIDAIRNELHWEVRCLETAFGIDTSKWTSFWDTHETTLKDDSTS